MHICRNDDNEANRTLQEIVCQIKRRVPIVFAACGNDGLRTVHEDGIRRCFSDLRHHRVPVNDFRTFGFGVGRHF